MRTYGYNYRDLFGKMDVLNKGVIDEQIFLAFVRKYQSRVEFVREEFVCLCKRLGRERALQLTFDDLNKALLPFEPSSFPIFRKENNLKEALNYVLKEVGGLNIETNAANVPTETLNNKQFSHTNSSFRKIYDPYSNNPQSGSAQYFYDKDYLNELKEYKMTYYDPNRNFKGGKREENHGLQYHDHFFEDYYRHLYDRTKSE